MNSAGYFASQDSFEIEKTVRQYEVQSCCGISNVIIPTDVPLCEYIEKRKDNVIVYSPFCRIISDSRFFSDVKAICRFFDEIFRCIHLLHIWKRSILKPTQYRRIDINTRISHSQVDLSLTRYNMEIFNVRSKTGAYQMSFALTKINDKRN